MKIEEIIIGTPITYYGVITDEGEKLYPVESEITTGPRWVGTELVCEIKDVIGVVSIEHLEIRKSSPSPAEGASLEQIKQQYAIDRGYENWHELELDNGKSDMCRIWPEVAERYHAAQQSQAKAQYPLGVYVGKEFPDYYGRDVYVKDDNSDPDFPCYALRFDGENRWHDNMSEDDFYLYDVDRKYPQAKASDITGTFEVQDDDKRDRSWVLFREYGKEDVILYKRLTYVEACEMCNTLNSLFSSSQTSPVGEGFLKVAVDNFNDVPRGENVFIENNGRFLIGKKLDEDTISEIGSANPYYTNELKYRLQPVTFPLSSSHPEVSNNGWITVEQDLPKAEIPCLAFYTNHNGKTRRVRAFYAPPHTIEYDGEEIGFAVEQNEIEYLPEGWYECNENEETHWMIHEKVTHWMPLPKGPSIEANT